MEIMMRVTVEQMKTVPMLASESTCSGKTYVVTGSNTGEKAKKDIEESTGRQGVVQVWHLDMASYASIQSFAKRASEELDIIHGFIANAGVMVDQWQLTEGIENTIFVNVVGTIYLAALMMPQLMASGRKSGTHVVFAFVGSTLGYTAKPEVDKSRGGVLFDGFNDPKRALIAQRYSLSKLLEECAVRQFAALCPVEKTGVIMNIVAPGLCSTGLGRDAGPLTRATLGTMRAMAARTPAVGSRVILSGLVLGDESHGKLISGAKMKEHWVPDWLSNADGQQLQKDVWKELVQLLERVQPGCISHLSQFSDSSA